MPSREHDGLRQALPWLLAALLAGAGCASAPPRSPGATAAAATSSAPAAASARHVGLAVAAGMIGSPYRYGGEDPRGFDCSGLVYFAFRKAGLDVPRTTEAQYRHASAVALPHLEPGDLLFFRLGSRKVSHVGIYAGDARFIHAPSDGKAVSYAAIDDPYWRRRLVGARRLD